MEAASEDCEDCEDDSPSPSSVDVDASVVVLDGDGEDDGIDADECGDDDVNVVPESPPNNIASPSTKPKHKQSCGRAERKYTPAVKATTSGSITKNKGAKEKPPSAANCLAYLRKEFINVNRGKNKPTENIDPSKQGYILSHGYLYCDPCKTNLHWRNRDTHTCSDKHKKNLVAFETKQMEIDGSIAKVQQRISEEQLVGSTYMREKIEAQMSWLKVAFRSNWSLKSIEDNRVSHVHKHLSS